MSAVIGSHRISSTDDALNLIHAMAKEMGLEMTQTGHWIDITQKKVEPKVVSVRWEDTGTQYIIHGVMDNNWEEILFAYFPDELSFEEHELIGKTKSECSSLHYAKDVAYMQS